MSTPNKLVDFFLIHLSLALRGHNVLLQRHLDLTFNVLINFVILRVELSCSDARRTCKSQRFCVLRDVSPSRVDLPNLNFRLPALDEVFCLSLVQLLFRQWLLNAIGKVVLPNVLLILMLKFEDRKDLPWRHGPPYSGLVDGLRLLGRKVNLICCSCQFQPSNLSHLLELLLFLIVGANQTHCRLGKLLSESQS